MTMKFKFIIPVVILGWMTVGYAQNPGAQPVKLNSAKDKLSYALGNLTGRTFSSHHVDVDPKLFALGFEDAMTAKKSLLSTEEMNNVVRTLQDQKQQQTTKETDSVAKINLQNGMKFLQANKQKPGVVTTKSGLQFKIIKAGNGKHPIPSDVVVVNYEGKLLDGTVFDSSYKRGQPAVFPVGSVIKGWQEALQLMSVGAKWEVFVPSQLAYGDENYPPMLGPNQTLIFTIEVIAIKKQ